MKNEYNKEHIKENDKASSHQNNRHDFSSTMHLSNETNKDQLLKFIKRSKSKLYEAQSTSSSLSLSSISTDLGSEKVNTDRNYNVKLRKKFKLHYQEES